MLLYAAVNQSGRTAEPERHILVEEFLPGHVVRAVARERQADHAIENIDRGGAQVQRLLRGMAS